MKRILLLCYIAFAITAHAQSQKQPTPINAYWYQYTKYLGSDSPYSFKPINAASFVPPNNTYRWLGYDNDSGFSYYNGIKWLAMLNRANAFGQQAQSTITGLTDTLANRLKIDAVQVASISALQAYNGNSLLVQVTDSLRGGMFYYTTANLTVDNAIVFPATGKGSGYMVRQFNTGTGINIKWFDAKGDGVTDDGPAIQRAVNYIAAGNTRAYMVMFPPGTYLVNTTINLPLTIANVPMMLFSGYGATLKTTTSTTILSRMPVDQAAASLAIVNYRAVFEGINFTGTQTIGQKAFDIGATYGWEINGGTFTNLDTAIAAHFWLEGNIHGGIFVNNKSVAILGTSGLNYWSGATTSNSAFNITKIDNCRVYNGPGSFTSLMLMATNGVYISNFTSEGAAPRYNFYVDYQGSTVVNATTFENIWCESSGPAGQQGTNFYFRTKGTTTVRNLNRSLQDTIFNIDNTGATNQTFIFDNIPTMSNLPAVCFNGSSSTLTGYQVNFKNMGIMNPNTIITASKWVGGVMPSVLTVESSLSANSGYAISSTGDINLTPTSQTANQGYVYVKGLITPQDNTNNWGNRGGTLQRPLSIWAGTNGFKTDTTAAYEFNTTGSRDVYLTRRKANVFQINATGGTVMSKGTAATRDPAPTAGTVYFDTDTAWFVGYTGSAWVALARSSGQNLQSVTDAGNITTRDISITSFGGVFGIASGGNSAAYQIDKMQYFSPSGGPDEICSSQSSTTHASNTMRIQDGLSSVITTIAGIENVPRQDATDANVTLNGNTQVLVLPAITSNRTITLSSTNPASTKSRVIYVLNLNTSGNTWSFVSGIRDMSGGTVTTLTNAKSYQLVYDGTFYRVLN